MHLVEALDMIEDFRHESGRRHPLSLVLLLVIMAMMSGCTGYRAIGAFITRHKDALVKGLQIPKDRVPSYSTVRRVLLGLCFVRLSDVFTLWARAQGFTCTHVAIDGKSIKATVDAYDNAQQDFTALVSAFAREQGLVLQSIAYQNKEQSEIEVVEHLIRGLGLQGVVFTMDALHCQKKR